MQHLEACADQQIPETMRCQRTDRLSSSRRQPSHSGFADVCDCSSRGDQQLPARAKDRRKLGERRSLIAVPMERLRADDDVRRRRPERQVERISAHEVRTVADSIERFGEHASRGVEADNLGVRPPFCQSSGELTSPASEIQHHVGLRSRETSQHRIVNWSVHRILKPGAVVDNRPPIEQRRSRIRHGPLLHRVIVGGSSGWRPTA